MSYQTVSMDKYIGEKKVKGIEWNIVTFEDNSTKTLTDKQLTYMVTDEPKDLSAMRDLVIDNVSPEVFKVLEDHNIRYWDVDAILQSVLWWFHVAFWRAVWHKFGTFYEGWHIEDFKEDVDMALIKDAWKDNFNF